MQASYISTQHYLKTVEKNLSSNPLQQRFFKLSWVGKVERYLLLITESFASFSLENANFDSSEAEQRRTKTETIKVPSGAPAYERTMKFQSFIFLSTNDITALKFQLVCCAVNDTK